MNKALINSTICVSICVCYNKVYACICENNNKQKLTIRILNTVFVMKRKKGYETPLIEKFRVELEEGVCNTASVMTETGSKAVVNEHETGFDGSYGSGFTLIENENTGNTWE